MPIQFTVEYIERSVGEDGMQPGFTRSVGEDGMQPGFIYEIRKDKYY